MTTNSLTISLPAPIQIGVLQIAAPIQRDVIQIKSPGVQGTKGDKGDAGTNSQQLVPVEHIVTNAAIDQIIALAATPTVSNKLYLNGRRTSQSNYSISNMTLTIPRQMVWLGVECIFDY